MWAGVWGMILDRFTVTGMTYYKGVSISTSGGRVLKNLDYGSGVEKAINTHTNEYLCYIKMNKPLL